MSSRLKVSVVIPCRNEEKHIQQCIESVLASDYPQELLHVLVCDGRSTDRTRELIQQFQSNPSVQLIDNPEQTTPFALNYGIQVVLTDVVIILGAHAEIASDYVRLCVETLIKYPDTGCVGGVLDTISEDEQTASIALSMSSSFGVGNAYFRTGERAGYVDTVAFGAYRRSVFESIGLFNPILARNQDDEFNFRLLKSGSKIFLNPDIRAKYYVRSSFSKLFRQYRQYGYWKVFVNREQATVTTLRQLIPPIWVAYLFALPLAFLIHQFLGLFWLLGILAYLILSLFSAVRMANSVKQFIQICWSFYILHFSYGIGYLEGIIDFILLRKTGGKQNTSLSR
jgi:glycosyltransferase involved in cell wall biosynthesis